LEQFQVPSKVAKAFKPFQPQDEGLPVTRKRPSGRYSCIAVIDLLISAVASTQCGLERKIAGVGI